MRVESIIIYDLIVKSLLERVGSVSPPTGTETEAQRNCTRVRPVISNKTLNDSAYIFNILIEINNACDVSFI